MKQETFLVVGSLVLGLCLAASATVHRVPDEYATIQAAIDAAANGDTVLVADGTYTGVGNRDIDFGGRTILVTSESGPATCIIDCQHAGRGLHFHTGETQGSEVRGFTVRNSQTETIFCESASPTIADCIIRASDAEGVFCWDGSSPMLEDCIITANAARGVYCEYLCSPTVTGCAISNNGDGGLAFYDQCSPAITGCDIWGNYDAYGGGGIDFGNNCFGTVEECAIIGNTAVVGGGIACDNYAAPSIAGNTIANNVAHHGGGIDCQDNASPMITGNTIRANWCFYHAGGINCGYYSSPTIEECIIAENIADGGDGGAIRCGDYSSPLIVDCLLKENTAEWLGGGIYCDYECDLILRNCVVTHNEAVWGYGGGLEFERSAPAVDNCTVVYNTSGDLGGGIACFAFNQPPEVINTIVWGNSPDQIYGDPATVTYCDVEGGWPGVGNIDGDPEFILPGLLDYRLLWESPCIDAGHPDSLDPDGTTGDIGAHFFDQDDYMTIYLTPDATEISPGGVLGVTYTAINRWTQAEPFWLHTQVKLPNGNMMDVVGPEQHTLPPQYTAQVHMTHNVPQSAPGGEYEYITRIGMPPATLYGKDKFVFEVVLAPDYLIWEPDSTPISGLAIMNALEANGRTSAFVMGNLGDYDLSLYQGLFVCVGMWPNNRIILEGSDEATQIESYIADGGDVYLEGGDIWYYDPTAGGHDFGPTFGIDGLDDGGNDLFTVSGVANTLMPGLSGLASGYTGENSWVDELAAIAPAQLVFTNADNTDDIGVAKSAVSGGHTIGTSFEIGGTAYSTFLVPAVAEFIDFFEGSGE